MALTSTTIQTVAQPVKEQPKQDMTTEASLLGMLVLSLYAAKKSKKALRKLKMKLLWEGFKNRITSIFKKPAAVSNRTLIYILIGIVFLALLFIDPIVALAVALVALILILLGAI